MKRIFSTMLVLSVMLLSTSFSVFAQGRKAAEQAELTQICETEYYEDGSYCITTISEYEMRSTISGTKTRNYYNANNVLEWKVQVHGAFTYNGVTSSCTSASHTITIYNDSWFAHSQNSYKSDNKAIADVTMKKKLLGVVTSTRDVHLELACDKNGNLS